MYVQLDETGCLLKKSFKNLFKLPLGIPYVSAFLGNLKLIPSITVLFYLIFHHKNVQDPLSESRMTVFFDAYVLSLMIYKVNIFKS